MAYAETVCSKIDNGLAGLATLDLPGIMVSP